MECNVFLGTLVVHGFCEQGCNRLMPSAVCCVFRGRFFNATTYVIH